MFAMGTMKLGIIVFPKIETAKKKTSQGMEISPRFLTQHLKITTKLCECHAPLVIIQNACHKDDSCEPVSD